MTTKAVLTRNQEDDLTRIRGIGPATQKWFGEKLSVRQFAHLAAIPAAEIEAQMRSDGRIASHNEIESWQAQARELALENETAINAKMPAPALTNWRSLATVVVEYQVAQETTPTAYRTRVHYMEVDQDESWPGIEFEQVPQWLKAHLPVAISDQPLAIAPSPGDQTQIMFKQVGEAKIVPQSVHLSQHPAYHTVWVLGEEKRPFLAHVSHAKPIQLQLDLNVPELGAPPPLSAKCYLHNLSTLWADVRLMTPVEVCNGTVHPALRLDNLMLEPGMYEVSVMVQAGKSLAAQYVALPKLHVM